VLWLGFLIVSTVEAVLWSLWGPNYFPTERSLFPTWPVWRPERVEALFGSVFAVLLLAEAARVRARARAAPRGRVRRRVRAAAQRAMRDDHVGAVRADPHALLLPVRAQEPDRRAR
jgi:hypothetical protein